MPNDTRLHKEGGSNLLAAAEELGVARYIMQSRGFYLDAPSGQLADETATLRYDAPGPIGESTRVMGAYEDRRSEEHTSELQSLMRISYAVFCMQKKK